jgi:activator of HSP90 ATPase
MAEKTTSFEQVEIIPATPGEVFEALVDAEKHTAFTGAEATGEGVEGAVFTAWDGYIQGRIVKLEEGRLIVEEWSTSEWPKGQEPSQVSFHLEPCAEGTRLTLVHSRVPVSQAGSYQKGWVDYYWTPLKEHFS